MQSPERITAEHSKLLATLQRDSFTYSGHRASLAILRHEAGRPSLYGRGIPHTATVTAGVM